MNSKVVGLHIEEPNIVGKHNNIDWGYDDVGKIFVDFGKQNNRSIAKT